MSLALDASVVVKRFVDEERSATACALVDAPHDFTAPEILLDAELNAAWRKLRRNEIDADQYEAIVPNLRPPLVELRPLVPLAPQAAPRERSRAAPPGCMRAGASIPEPAPAAAGRP